MHLTLPRIGTWEAFRSELRRVAAAGVPPEEVSWSRGTAEGGLDLVPEADLAPRREARAPKAFAGFARLVAHHSDPERFALLHLLLDRLQSEKGLMEVRTDPLLTRLYRMEKAVRRDLHKMHAFVRFREVDAQGPRRRFAAWFEPDHPIVEPGAEHFAKRFADMDWTIATPDLTAVFEDGTLRIEDADAGPPPAEDATQALWNTYYSNIFNPARLKPDAMRAEMPKKYWRNLPEARLIPSLIAGAEARVRAMREAAPTIAPARAAAVAAQLREKTMDGGPDLFGHNSLAALNADAEARYPYREGITQLVPGEGPADADLMVVGEQPGDQEDLAGRPFVGPAGQLFDRLAEKAGLPRDRVYVTNATKHFKYEPRGKFRMHKSPTLTEIKNVRWWLDEERALIDPKVILAMGGSAAYALTGNKKDMLKRRSSVETAMGGRGEPVFITVHPSFLLRLPDEESRAREQERFVSDLKDVWKMVEAA
ncbi:DNA polymerase [Hasllibacter halocynthiae]|uniref:Type-4 uracil-DNA glycosylase n=1 Tax=Hasllibacter halocynthiae TaxID=595589 RepID=A0A2T0X464_9RHOB|nr:UdgX family uracil-DNA binding protein [Hasllibacter halocynthiae]PRY93738.1 DNA polymerase [Hasllibacter halocynthiae]